jgi:two-component system NtrC family response regulator/two-component system nitrogen regulation response regulator GlnG
MAKILLIDDDADLSHFLREDLAGYGHEVHCLERAERGPELLLAAAPPFDLVLLDNNLPGMSGIDFLGALQARAVKVPVILMTGYTTCDTAIQATYLGASYYVIKPDDFQTLAIDLRPLIDKVLEVPSGARAARRPPAGPLVGRSKAMVAVYTDIGRFARSNDAVLIVGETGTGKELVARALHDNSPRKDRPFVPVNCASLPDTLLESELFGHEKGAFTGAVTGRAGKFELADGGTLFLDEIGDMPFALQAKLLRVLQSQEVQRLGSAEVIRVNVRILSATNSDLEAGIREGRFRRDLLHRLNRLTIRLPPLRERLDDLPDLIDYFLARAAAEWDVPVPSLAAATVERLRGYPWPGNVRELENVLRRAAQVCHGFQILPTDLGLPHDEEGRSTAAGADVGAEEIGAALHRAVLRAWDTYPENLWPLLHDRLEKELLRAALEKLGGNQTRVAERLGMARGTVISRMQKYGLK